VSSQPCQAGVPKLAVRLQVHRAAVLKAGEFTSVLLLGDEPNDEAD
jgi:hypothetical protein